MFTKNQFYTRLLEMDWTQQMDFHEIISMKFNIERNRARESERFSPPACWAINVPLVNQVTENILHTCFEH